MRRHIDFAHLTDKLCILNLRDRLGIPAVFGLCYSQEFRQGGVWNWPRRTEADVRRMSSCVDDERQNNGRIWIRKYAIAEKKDTAIKYVSLIVLVIQNASQVLVMRYVRTRPREMFLSTVAIFFAEVVKLIVCILFLTIQEKSLIRCLKVMYEDIIKQPIDTLKVCVPAVIYVIQNNLLYVAVSNLPAATYMVTYQLKILTTAVFTVTILRRRLSLLQWLALVLLFGGIALVQLGDERTNMKMIKGNITSIRDNSSGIAELETIRDDGSGTAESGTSYKYVVEQNPINGFAAVLVACILSGFSGIYLEKILKDSDVSVWVRNVQLAIISLPVALVNVLIQDIKKVLKHGVLVGFDITVWCLILLSSVGGITVAIVIKYADNILKAFAASIAIIVACIASALLFKFRPAVLFLVGTVFVIGAIFMYSLFPYKKKYQQAPTEPPHLIQQKEETAIV
ncbi:UDP-galactose/UDP-N-acetylglucosamine transporter srf-3 [Dirofilaria immitis]